MLRIDLSRASERFVQRLPPKHQRQIARKLQQLRDNPTRQDAKPLQGYPYLRTDQGEYRIIYSVEANILKVRLIGKRNDDEVYRQLDRSE